MTPSECAEFLIRNGWKFEAAIRHVHSMMEFPWGIEEDPQITEHRKYKHTFGKKRLRASVTQQQSKE